MNQQVSQLRLNSSARDLRAKPKECQELSLQQGFVCMAPPYFQKPYEGSSQHIQVSYLGIAKPGPLNSCVSMQPELAISIASEPLIVQLGTHREGLVNLGRKLIALKPRQQELTSGEHSEALSGRCFLDLRELMCVCVDAHPTGLVDLQLVVHRRSEDMRFLRNSFGQQVARLGNHGSEESQHHHRCM